jgi:hypothetical protein
VDESLAVLVLPATLEEFELQAHARDLLSIPRVVALEPSRRRAPRFMRDAAAMRQARRLRFPGRPVLILLYHPEQYPLARALSGRYGDAELWYLPPRDYATGSAEAQELLTFDELARQRATQTLPTPSSDDGPAGPDEALRLRLRELGVISHRPFVPVRGVRGRR